MRNCPESPKGSMATDGGLKGPILKVIKMLGIVLHPVTESFFVPILRTQFTPNGIQVIAGT